MLCLPFMASVAGEEGWYTLSGGTCSARPGFLLTSAPGLGKPRDAINSTEGVEA